MDTASFRFVLFGLLAALLSNLSRSPKWRSAVLLLASIVFLGLLSQNIAALIPLAGFLIIGYIGLIVSERNRSPATTWSVLVVLCIYIWLKKYAILPVTSFLHFPYLSLGISYILFRVLHLQITAHDEEPRRHISVGAYLLYTLNFTTLVTGPIQLYGDFARDQFAPCPIRLGPVEFGDQLERIVRGFFKVNVLATLLHLAQEDALVQLAHSSPGATKLCWGVCLAMVYPFFLYANFSGYVDVVIALARLMRLRLPENFARPFAASSFLDFWNRWHITLSTWFKIYVYNPLLVRLMRQNSSAAMQPYLGVFSFFVTFFLLGIWHGRTSEFLFFGVLQGIGVSVNKIWQIGLARRLGRGRYKELSSSATYTSLGRGLTFSWFALTLFWFWGSWSQLHELGSSLGIYGWLAVGLATWLIATTLLAAWEDARARLLSLQPVHHLLFSNRYVRMIYASALGLASFVLTTLLSQPAPGIVYKAF